MILKVLGRVLLGNPAVDVECVDHSGATPLPRQAKAAGWSRQQASTSRSLATMRQPSCCDRTSALRSTLSAQRSPLCAPALCVE